MPAADLETDPSQSPELQALGLVAQSGRGTARDVVRQLAGSIQRGDLRLGDRLPAERALALHLGVSRMTVRQALGQLRAAGVLESRSQRGRESGTFVRSEAVPVGLITPTPTQFEAIRGVLDARRMFEPPVAVLAGANRNKDDLESLERILQAQESAHDDAARVRELDPSFHIGIARATHNDVVVVMMQTLLERLALSRNPPLDDPDEASKTIAIHRETLDAIADGDPTRIKLAMRRHLRLLESSWEAHTGELMPPWPAENCP